MFHSLLQIYCSLPKWIQVHELKCRPHSCSPFGLPAPYPILPQPDWGRLGCKLYSALLIGDYVEEQSMNQTTFYQRGCTKFHGSKLIEENGRGKMIRVNNGDCLKKGPSILECYEFCFGELCNGDSTASDLNRSQTMLILIALIHLSHCFRHLTMV